MGCVVCFVLKDTPLTRFSCCCANLLFITPRSSFASLSSYSTSWRRSSRSRAAAWMFMAVTATQTRFKHELAFTAKHPLQVLCRRLQLEFTGRPFTEYQSLTADANFCTSFTADTNFCLSTMSDQRGSQAKSPVGVHWGNATEQLMQLHLMNVRQCCEES